MHGLELGHGDRRQQVVKPEGLDAQAFEKLFQRFLLKRSKARDARAVQDGGDGSQSLLRVVNRAPHRGQVRHVRLEIEMANATLLKALKIAGYFVAARASRFSRSGRGAKQGEADVCFSGQR